MDVHAPYNRDGETWFGDGMSERETQMVFRKAKYLPSRVSSDERRALVDEYDNGVRRFDEVMRDLFGRLESEGVLEGTVVFVTSDHGESLGENNEYAHRQALSPEVLRVPLWISGDGDETVRKPVSTVDILPTIAEKTGPRRRLRRRPSPKGRQRRSPRDTGFAVRIPRTRGKGVTARMREAEGC